VKLVKRSIDALPPVEKGAPFYWDNVLSGFGLRVRSSGKKHFIAQYRVGAAAKGRDASALHILLKKAGPVVICGTP